MEVILALVAIIMLFGSFILPWINRSNIQDLFEEIQNDLKTNKNLSRATMKDLELAISICQQRLQHGRKQPKSRI